MKYLGEFPIDIKDTPYKGWSQTKFALDFIRNYGGIDGDHHKAWVLDQLARILNGAPVTIKVARWDNGLEEYRLSVGTSRAYERYVRDACGDGVYSWSCGIAP